jgi:hypothetical protein
VHIYLPFMGTHAKDTYETGSKARIDRRNDDSDRNVLSGAFKDEALADLNFG